MKVLLMGVRLFLGLFLLANGLNFWFGWLAISVPESEQANRLMDGLVISGMFGLVKYVEIAAGAALLANRFVPLALALMLPLTVVIAYVDYVLIAESQAVVFATLLVLPQTILMLAHLRSYLPMLALRAEPAALPNAADLRAAVVGAEC